MTDFLIYDVFTDTAFGGNPLAIIPDATGLPEDRLQGIAREFNLSETTFVYPAADTAHDARVRIFTPGAELPFAGHPTVGTALALHDLGKVGDDLTFELGVGPIPVRIRQGVAEFTTRVPLETWPGPSPRTVAECTGLDVSAVRVDRHPPIIASVGLPFAFAELTGKDALSRIELNTDAFRAFNRHWPTTSQFDLVPYVRDGARIDARMFAPLGSIPEDPATGSAAAALTAYLGQLTGASGQFDITQGEAMGRPSQIKASVTVENGTPAAVSIAGQAVKVMEGRLFA